MILRSTILGPRLLALTLALVVGCACSVNADETKMLTAGERAERLDAMAERYFRPLVEQEWAVGIAVGVIDERGRRVFGFGRAVDDQPRPPAGDTVFEIGSVTKVFTGLLLADMAERGQVKLDQPVNELLPEDIGPLRCGKRPMQLIDLATHTSGLPRLPGNLSLSDMDDPYAAYTADMLYACLKERAEPSPLQSLGRSIAGLVGAATAQDRSQWEYSNLGVGLLGHLLERRAGRPYEELVAEHICRPLGMQQTRVSLDEALRAKLAAGHDADGKVVKNWNLGCLVAAGGLRSSADDLLQFVAAQLELVETPLRPAIAKTQQPHRNVKDGLDMGLNWMLAKPDLVLHDGMTGGYCSFVGFSRGQKVGVVVLANSAVGGQSGVLGRAASGFFKALREQEPGDPPSVRAVKKLDRAVLQKYAGQYTLVPLVATLTVTYEDDRLYAELTGQPRFRIYPESESKFFYKVVNAQITFERDDAGNVERLILHQNGKDMRAAKQ